MASPPESLTTLLARLAETGVEFLLVGGLAAVAQGAPLTTHDVDIVHRRTRENIVELLRFLTMVHARYRRPGPAIEPSAETLAGSGHHLLITDLGPLDVLGAIEHGKRYEDLVPDAITIRIGDHPVHILGLRALVELKRHATGERDRLSLAILEETLRRQSSES